MIGKVDHHIRLINAIDQFITDQRTGSTQAQRMADVSSDNRMTRHLNRF